MPERQSRLRGEDSRDTPRSSTPSVGCVRKIWARRGTLAWPKSRCRSQWWPSWAWRRCVEALNAWWCGYPPTTAQGLDSLRTLKPPQPLCRPILLGPFSAGPLARRGLRVDLRSGPWTTPACRSRHSKTLSFRSSAVRARPRTRAPPVLSIRSPQRHKSPSNPFVPRIRLAAESRNDRMNRRQRLHGSEPRVACSRLTQARLHGPRASNGPTALHAVGPCRTKAMALSRPAMHR